MADLKPEEKARVKIDRQLKNAGWDIVSRGEYVPNSTTAVMEALMKGNKESDYLLFIEGKATAVVEAKREDNPLGKDVAQQAEYYAKNPQSWYPFWGEEKSIPLVYLANGKKIYFKNMLTSNSEDAEYTELSEMHSPKKMLQIIKQKSDYGALPIVQKKGLRDCQYEAELTFEESLKEGNKRNLAVMATGSGKTYLACMAAYRLLNYTDVSRVLFLVDRNNLGKQALSEFSLFDKTEKGTALSSLYRIERLKKEEHIKADIVISTIQKLFAVLTGQKLIDRDEDEEDEETTINEENTENEIVKLGDKLNLPPDYFQFIVVDECHRSIYGKWKAVLDYFKDAIVLGLTATPTPETDAFFNKNYVQKYTFDNSVVDGVNVPSRIYKIATLVSTQGSTIEEGKTVTETIKRTGVNVDYNMKNSYGYTPVELDRSVVNKNQIRQVLESYKRAIYTDLYPEREEKWEYIPKTLIFAKDDNHATNIVEAAKEVFSDKFVSGEVPENFVKKITYKAGKSEDLITEMCTDKTFRIAVTVTLVATGTDIKPLEVVFFMKDVFSDVLYTQMKGRGCRTISDDKLKEVTPNAETKEMFYIVDAVGVTEHEKYIPKILPGPTERVLSLEHLLEHLSHNEVSDDNLMLLRDYCSSINRRYEGSALFGKHLTLFIESFGFMPRTLANDINNAIEQGELPEYISPSEDNYERLELICRLIDSIPARNKLLEMQKGYYVESDESDETLYAGFSKEAAKEYIDNFEDYLLKNKDSIEALRIIYNSENTVITHSMLMDLKEKLLIENRAYGIKNIWDNYRVLDEEGNVENLNLKANISALTNLIQIVKYAFGKNRKLVSLLSGYEKQLNLYFGQIQRELTPEQQEIMRQIARYIVNDGAISVAELNQVNTDLWRKAVKNIGKSELPVEIQSISRFLLKVA